MQVVNIHKRTINQPKAKVVTLLGTLSIKYDKVWPKDKWPAMRFKNGLKVGEKGGHGIIRYTVETYDIGEQIVFRFLKPKGFNGIHKFEIKAIDAKSTEVKHSIIMKTEGLATLKWIFVIRWLHDALIENAFDRIENNFLETKTFTKWTFWVRIWRYILK
ncbi:hypothetical protein [uncultured Algibacter sp.]|uniref:hypothetical protein n=1 Tax=uncultured Algibacter sp. TaxID=298659 RepID=UPI00262B32A8|nr:hypothetical protein [uncultured Algibacter sp.]